MSNVVKLSDRIASKNTPCQQDAFPGCPDCEDNHGYIKIGGKFWFVCWNCRNLWSVDEADLNRFAPAMTWPGAPSPCEGFLIVEPHINSRGKANTLPDDLPF